MNKTDTIAIIRSILSSTKYTYTVCKLNDDFKKETGLDIPTFGYGSLSDFLHSIPDTVKISGMYPIEQVYLVRSEKSNHIVSLVNRTKAPDQKKHTFRGQSGTAIITNGVRNIKSPNWIGVKDVEKHNGKDLSPIIKSDSTNCSLTCSLKSSDSKISLKNFVHVGEEIPPIDINLHAKVGEYAEVCPNYIFSPHKFYFHFRKFRNKFSDFMDKIQHFYEVHERIPEMTERVIKPKLMCAIFYNLHNEPMWHRVEINEIVSRSHVIVTFIDCGYKTKVPKASLKYLHRDFLSLPKQAILGSLANIRPSKRNSEWSQEAIDRFSTLALQRDLLAGVVVMDPETCSVKVALSCTKGLELHINDTLVKEGYAEFDVDVLNKHSAESLKTPVSRAWKMNINKIEPKNGKTAFNKEGKLQSQENHGSPIFYVSNNERLQKMFSAA